MKSIHTWFAEYSVSHQNPTNKLVHWVCVPLIFFSIVGLLASIPLGKVPSLFPVWAQPFVHLGTFVLTLAMLFYLRLSPALTLGLLLFGFLCLGGIYMLNQTNVVLWQACLLIFALAWVGQFWGHKIEGAKPSFLKDIQFLLIGPAWLMGFIYQGLGIKY